MKTKQAVKLAGTQRALAEILGITPAAVCQWGKSIPPLRLYQLKEKKPEWFAAPIPAGEPGDSGMGALEAQ